MTTSFEEVILPLASALELPKEALLSFSAIENASNIFSKMLQLYSKLQQDNSQSNVSLHASEQILHDATIEIQAKTKELDIIKQEYHGLERNLKDATKNLLQEKKDLVQILDRRQMDIQSLDQDYKVILAQNAEIRRELAESEVQVSKAQGDQLQAKIEVQYLEQQIILHKKSADDTILELNTRLEEHSKYRKSKLQEIESLKADLEMLSTRSETVQSNYDQLKSKFDDTSQTLLTTKQRLLDLQNSTVGSEESFKQEVQSHKRLADLWQKSAEEAQSRIQQLEDHLKSNNEKESKEMQKWMKLAEVERDRADTAENEIVALKNKFLQLNEELEIKDSLFDQQQLDRGINLLSPSVLKLPGGKICGMSLTELYSNFIATKKDLVNQTERNEDLQNSLDSLIHDLKIRAPQILQQQQELVQAKEDLANISKKYQESLLRYEELERQNNTETETLSKLQSELRLSSIMNRDLSRQIQYMLQINEDLRNGVSLDISLQFFKNINAVESNEIDISDTDIVISERLTTFRNIEELHQQNQNLLRVVRQLGDRMEKEEKEHQTRMENLESSAILNATQMIDELQAELRSVRIQREGLLRENDILKGSSIRQPTPHEDKTPSPQNNKCTTPPIHINQDNLRVLEKNFEIYRRETSADMQELNEEIKKLSEEKTQTQIIANKFQAQLEFTEERHALLLASNSAFRELN